MLLSGRSDFNIHPGDLLSVLSCQGIHLARKLTNPIGFTFLEIIRMRSFCHCSLSLLLQRSEMKIPTVSEGKIYAQNCDIREPCP